MLDDLIRKRKFNMIGNVLDESSSVMNKLIQYDDMPSQAFEDSIIKDATVLSKKLLGCKLVLEDLNGD